MLRLFVRNNDHLEIAACDLASVPAKPAGAAWYDLFNPTPEEDRFVEASLGIDIPTREEMKDIEPSARLYKEAGAEFMTMTAMTNLDTDQPVKSPITFVLQGRHPGDGALFRPEAVQAISGAAPASRAACRSAAASRSCWASSTPSSTGWRRCWKTPATRSTQSRTRCSAPSSGDKHERQDLQSVIERIGRKGELLTMARESLLSILRLTSFHQAGGEGKKATAALRQEAKTLQRDATALADHAAYLSNKINFLLDATLGLINLEQNQIIKIFTVAAVVFLPPTLVASVYGMNFDFMPELKWTFGYPLAIVIMVASAILPFAYFKRRGWL